MLDGGDATAVLDRQTAVMEELASGASLPTVLDSIVLALEELMPGSRCAILLLDNAGKLRHGSAPTLPAEYSAEIDGLVPGPLAGSCGTAVHLGEPVIAVDVSTDPRWERFRPLAARHGLRACWSTPIRSGSQVVGSFAVYRDAPYEPDTRDHQLVGRFTHLTSLAVEHDRASKEREARHEADLARQTAEHANHAKSQFVTALSHELRTPLQAITSFTENLQTLDLSPDQRRGALERIGRAASHILSIVDDVLDLARVEAGAMPIEPEDLDLYDEIAAALELIDPLAARRAIGVECSGPSVWVRADRRRIRQVVLNLVSNAVRFSPADTVIRVASEAAEGWARIHIIDEGPGIPSDLMARLFVPFDRLGADAGREGGAGLGLVLARRLTEAMDGTLELESVVGVGTHAVVTLPAAEPGAGPAMFIQRDQEIPAPMETIADRYDRLAAAFAAKIGAVPSDRWDMPSPCEGWTARDVVRHVSETPGLFLGFVGQELGELPDDPAGAFAASRQRVLAALRDPSVAAAEYEGFMGRMTFAEGIDRFINFDLVVHGWDLARAAGLDDRIAPEDLERIDEGSKGFGAAMRSPGAFGPELEAPADADRQRRVLAFLGREAPTATS